MKIDRPDPRIGAIATEVDVRTLSEADWNALYRAWLDGIVLVVRGQTLTIEEFLAYSRRFGRLKPHRVRKTRHPDHPELTLMGVGTRKPDGKVDKAIYNRGGGWHTNSPWDTGDLQGHAALRHRHPVDRRRHAVRLHVRRLREPAREPEEAPRGLQAEHAYGGRAREGNDLLEPEDRLPPPAVHPIVRTHEETGRTSLYANRTHILRIQGLGDSESDGADRRAHRPHGGDAGAVSPQMAEGRHRDLGQSLRAALGDRRLPDRGAAHPLARHHHAGRGRGAEGGVTGRRRPAAG